MWQVWGFWIINSEREGASSGGFFVRVGICRDVLCDCNTPNSPDAAGPAVRPLQMHHDDNPPFKKSMLTP